MKPLDKTPSPQVNSELFPDLPGGKVKRERGPRAKLPDDPAPQQLALTFDRPTLALATSRKAHAPGPRPDIQAPPAPLEERPNITRMVNVTNLGIGYAAKQLLNVLIELADYDTGKNCKPKVSTLAHRMEASERTVKRFREQLEAGGWIVRTGHLPKGIVVYAVDFAKIEAAYEAEHPTKQFRLLPTDAGQKCQSDTSRTGAGNGQKCQSDTSRSAKLALLNIPINDPIGHNPPSSQDSTRPQTGGRDDGLVDQRRALEAAYARALDAGDYPEMRRISGKLSTLEAATEREWLDLVDQWQPDTSDPKRLAHLPGFKARIKRTMRTRTQHALERAWQTHIRKNC